MVRLGEGQEGAPGLPGRDIRRFGDPVLKQEAREVAEFTPELRRLAERMIAVMDEADGVGLAAPQIGVQKKVMVWRDPETGEAHTLVNPVVVERSDDTHEGEEGCLSVPGATLPVPRANRVVVEGRDLEGSSIRVEAEGLLARIMQHEVDHLEGSLILDRTLPEERKQILRDMRNRSLGS